ncbi:MAG: hypothetical protein K8T10_17530 [Candidatus Eremiobacteraeota bacterium]|nr:hypothetical protein [Candidatus Eremiobacteraeota bacterium]
MNIPKKIVLMNRVFLFAGLIILLAFSYGCSGKKIEIKDGTKYNEVSGDVIEIDKYIKKGTTLILSYSPWDPVSVRQLRVVKNIDNKYGKLGLRTIVFVYEEKEAEKIKNTKQTEVCEFPFFLADSRTTEIFGEKELVPEILIVDSKKNIRQKIEGYIDFDSLEKILKKHMDITEF